MFSQKFRLAINHSFQFIPRTGSKFFITLDLRESNIKRKLQLYNNDNCITSRERKTKLLDE